MNVTANCIWVTNAHSLCFGGVFMIVFMLCLLQMLMNVLKKYTYAQMVPHAETLLVATSVPVVS